jgi:hypothetical protein
MRLKFRKPFSPYTNCYRYSDQNNAARVSNSLLTISTESLTKLVNPANGTEITGFPATPGDIGDLAAATLLSVLQQLGLETEGPRTARERRLRGFIGLKTNPA